MAVTTLTSSRRGAGAAAVGSFTALTVGATLGYGSPLVGVVLMVASLGATWLAIKASPGGGELLTLLAVVLLTAMLALLGDLPYWCLLAAGVAGGVYWFAARSRWWWLGLTPAVALQFALLQQRWHWGRAAIDVFDTLQTATAHLLHGANPYAFLYKDLAPLPKWHLVRAPFQYGPAALYLGVPGRLLGDVRVLAAVAAVAAAVAIVVVARRRGRDAFQRTTYLAASLPLWGPMIVNAWVDIYTAAGLTIWWALRDRHWLAGSIALGAGAAAKPVLLVGLLPLLVWDRNVRRDCAAAAVTAIVLCVPFLIWTGPREFIYDVVGVHVQVLNEVWPTSVTFDALLYQAHLPPIPDLVSVLVLLASVPVALAAWRPPRRDQQLLVASAFMIAALLLSRQSFLNYYFVVAIWILLAIAEQPAEPRARVA